MKKLILLLASMFMLAGCTYSESYYPSNGGNYVPKPEDQEGGGEEEEEDVPMCTYNFFFSFSATTKYNPFNNKDEEAPILSFRHAMLEPLGAIPEQVNTTEKVVALGKGLGFNEDPAFPKFIGFSFNGVCLDEDGLWDYATDYKQLAVVNLYGIWVSE